MASSWYSRCEAHIDSQAVFKSQHKLKRGLMQESAGEQDAGRIKQLCAEGEEAASFLKTFVVQGKLNERGNYGRAFDTTCHLKL